MQHFQTSQSRRWEASYEAGLTLCVRYSGGAEQNSVLTIGSSDCGGHRAEARHCWTALMMPEAEIGSDAMLFGQHHDLLCT